MIEAKEEVMTYDCVSVDFVLEKKRGRGRTTRLTVGACFFVDSRTPVVPMIAGSNRSFLVSVTLK